MRAFPVLLLVAALPAQAATHAKHPAPPAHAAKKPAPSAPASSAPKSIGTWDQWGAAAHTEGGQPICYAFTRASTPGRGDVVLTVTERPKGRDAVAISSAATYPKDAAVEVQVEGAKLPFYTSGRSAFARDGKAVIAAFGRGREAVAHGPGGNDTFSLSGFSAAYAAVLKQCPSK